MSSATTSGKTFSARLIAWQASDGRHDLPWQNTQDAYRIWLSEIMLQQTQVATVIPYYQRFLARFPNVKALAEAPLEAVLESWAGLGYYARARNLHRSAQIVASEYDGIFPHLARQIEQLPGVGRSTAAAIGAFAFASQGAILDGNVKRVLTRCFAVPELSSAAQSTKALWQLAESLLPATQIAAYTQGLMDLGATLCTRQKPLCPTCPMHDICIAYQEGRQKASAPSALKKPRPEKDVSVFLISDGARVLLERRPPIGIWGGLLALPESALGKDKDVAEKLARQHACRLHEISAMPALKHAFSHFYLQLHPVLCRVEPLGLGVAEAGWHWLPHTEIETAALPAPIRRLLRAMLTL